MYGQESNEIGMHRALLEEHRAEREQWEIERAELREDNARLEANQRQHVSWYPVGGCESCHYRQTVEEMWDRAEKSQ